MDTLDELYYGKINPENTVYHNENYRKAKEQFRSTLEILRSDISHENRDFLDVLSHEHREMEKQHGREMFRIGFSLAMKLCSESFSRNEQTNISCPFRKE